MKNLILTLLFVAVASTFKAQVVYEHLSNTNIYDYLDEMANLRVIQVNEVVKPYSRQFIYQKLKEIESARDDKTTTLNKRQSQELDFYLKAFVTEAPQPMQVAKRTDIFKKNSALATALNPPGVFYKDSVFTMALQPILGASYSSNANGSMKHTWGGASMYGYIGKSLGFYTSVRDNNEDRLMIAPDYFVQQSGVPVKNYGSNGVDYSESRGGITYAWKWGAVGLVKDHVEWGSGYNGTNIQSGRTPSFAMIKLQLKPVSWFEFNYYHGWLVSNVVDSSRSYWSNDVYRTVYYQKYIAANMFTVYPVKYLNVSVGNSVVYSDVGGGGPHAAYLIPFLFYKSVDHTLNNTNKDGESGQNSQMFLNISSRNINYLHLYFTLFIDDLSFSHFKKKEEHNLFSYKGGFKLSDFPVKNVSLITEMTFTTPLVYQHKIATQQYTSNDYNMGHYLRDNSMELFFGLQFRPLRGLSFMASYILGKHGDDYDYADCAADPDCNLHILPILNNIIWQNQQFQFGVRYEIVSNTYFFFDINHQNITGEQDKIEKFTPEYYWGNTNTITGGLNIGF